MKKYALFVVLVLLLAGSTVSSAIYLDDLEDVTISGVQDNQHLIYDLATANWTNEVFVGGADGYAGDKGHPHDQDLNITSSPTFVDITLSDYLNLDKDYTDDVSSLDDLSDVVISGVSDDEHLIYNSGTSKWENEAFVGGADGYAGDKGHPHNQDLNTTSGVVFTTLSTGQGAYELYAMNQDVESSDAVSFITVNTGQGANELYDMNQNVLTTSDVDFQTVDISYATGGKLLEAYSSGDDAFLYAETADSRSSAGFWFKSDGGEWQCYLLSGGTFALKDVTAGTLPLQVTDGAGSASLFVSSGSHTGFGDTAPTYRAETPDTADVSGRMRANAFTPYSDNRCKDWIGELPEQKVKDFCNLIEIKSFYPIDNYQNNDGLYSFGETDYSKIDIGVSAQQLAIDLYNAGFSLKLINNVVYIPSDSDYDLWSVNYNSINLIFCRYIQIIGNEVFGV